MPRPSRAIPSATKSRPPAASSPATPTSEPPPSTPRSAPPRSSTPCAPSSTKGASRAAARRQQAQGNGRSVARLARAGISPGGKCVRRATDRGGGPRRAELLGAVAGHVAAALLGDEDRVRKRLHLVGRRRRRRRWWLVGHAVRLPPRRAAQRMVWSPSVSSALDHSPAAISPWSRQRALTATASFAPERRSVGETASRVLRPAGSPYCCFAGDRDPRGPSRGTPKRRAQVLVAAALPGVVQTARRSAGTPGLASNPRLHGGRTGPGRWNRARRS